MNDASLPARGFPLFRIIAILLLIVPIVLPHTVCALTSADVIAGVNLVRQQRGLPALQEQSQLQDTARDRARVIIQTGTFSHVAPDGTEPWQVAEAFGYDALYIGENLAHGFGDVPSLIAAWLESPGHRNNIYSTRYNETGVDVVPEGDSWLVVQVFAQSTARSVQLKPVYDGKVRADSIAKSAYSENGETVLGPRSLQKQPLCMLLNSWVHPRPLANHFL